MGKYVRGHYTSKKSIEFLENLTKEWQLIPLETFKKIYGRGKWEADVGRRLALMEGKKLISIKRLGREYKTWLIKKL